MPVPGPGYAITARVDAPARPTSTGDLTAAVGHAGGVITAFDVVEARAESLVVDISVNARNTDHVEEIKTAIDALDGFSVRKVSDRTFLLHLGGKTSYVDSGTRLQVA